MCGSIVDIESPTAEIRRGKKERKKEERKKPQGKNIMACAIPHGGHNKLDNKSSVWWYLVITLICCTRIISIP